MKHLFYIITLLTLTRSYSQTTPVIEFEYIIESEVFKTDRKLSVRLPKAYLKDTNQLFAVAYLLDGQGENYLPLVQGITEFQSAANDGVPLIIVSIHSVNRFEEFLPIIHSDSSLEKRNSSQFADFLESEVFPLIESSFKTLPYRLGIGHSLGGSFLLYQTFREKPLFDGLILASPNTVDKENDLVKFGDQFLSSHKDLSTFLYVTAGTEGQMENMFRAATQELDSIVKSKKQKAFDWNFKLYQNESHNGTFPLTVSDGYVMFSQKWNFTKNDLVPMIGLTGKELENKILACFETKSVFRNSEVSYSIDNLIELYKLAYFSLKQYQLTLDIIELALVLCESNNKLDSTSCLKRDYLINAKNYAFLTLKVELGDKAFNMGNYEEACRLFESGLLNAPIGGTYRERIQAVLVFAKCGKIEEAFTQLELLANRYKLQGNQGFISDPEYSILHNDPRWDEYMKQLELNELGE